MCSPGNVWVGSQVYDKLVSGHSFEQRAVVEDVRTDDTKALVVATGVEVPCSAGAEVVIHGHQLRFRLREEPVDKGASDETRTAGYEHASGQGCHSGGEAVDSHLVGINCRAGCETRRCQTTAQRPSVCGVTRSANSGGITTQDEATLRV